MRLCHNVASLGVYKEQSSILTKQARAMSRISSGYKLNSAKDDPASIGQSERIRLQVRGLEVASRNVQDGVSMLQTFEGSLQNVTEMLQRVKELSVQAATGTNSTSDRTIVKGEINQLCDGINDILKYTDFNGVNPFTSDSKIIMPTGANAGENIDIPLHDISKDKLFTVNLGGGNINLKTDLDFKNPDDCGKAIEIADKAIARVLDIRGEYGAIENRFEDSYNNVEDMGDRLQGADSSLTDADMAAEMLELSRTNILCEAGTAMLAQSNKFPQDALQVLQNVKSM